MEHEELQLNLQRLQEWQTYQSHTLATTVAASPKVCVDLVFFTYAHTPLQGRDTHLHTKKTKTNPPRYAAFMKTYVFIEHRWQVPQRAL